jgi:hypothetical protein
VVLALNFRQLIAQRGQEIFVGGKNITLRCELDYRLRAGNGVDLAAIIGCLQLLGRDIGGEL